MFQNETVLAQDLRRRSTQGLERALRIRCASCAHAGDLASSCSPKVYSLILVVGNLDGQLSVSERLADGSFFADWDGDRDLNLVVGNRDGQLVLKCSSSACLELCSPGPLAAWSYGRSSLRD